MHASEFSKANRQLKELRARAKRSKLKIEGSSFGWLVGPVRVKNLANKLEKAEEKSVEHLCNVYEFGDFDEIGAFLLGVEYARGESPDGSKLV